jgi:hypothetical protein
VHFFRTPLVSNNRITRDEIIGLRVQRVLQSPWIIDESDANQPHYCSFYLLLESGLLVNMFEEELYRSEDALSTLIDTDELKPSQRANYIDRRIASVSIDHSTSELVVLFDNGCWLTPKCSHMGYGNYLLSGHIRDFNESDRAEPFVDYFDGSTFEPWNMV